MFIYGNNADFSLSHWSDDHPQQAKHQRHLHENHEILLLISGNVDYNIDGQSYVLMPYDLVFIPSLTYHFVTPKSNDTYENYVINFSHTFIEEARLNKLFIPPYIKNISHACKLRNMFANFDFYHETYSKPDFEEASRNLLNEILVLACYSPFDRADLHLSSEQSIIPIIASYISQNLESELNVEILSEELHFSKSYISNCFSAVMGIGLQHYINQKKIRAAHIDILNGMDVNCVAEKYAYKDYSSFYRQYIKIIGASPSKSKKQLP